jgi:hypothetical protein
MAPISAHVSPPAIAISPPTAHASSRRAGDGIRSAMMPLVRKIADPSTLPITREVVLPSPRARTNPESGSFVLSEPIYPRQRTPRTAWLSST